VSAWDQPEATATQFVLPSSLATTFETTAPAANLMTVLPQINTASLKDPNYLRQIRSLYVGNLPANISREHLIDFINSVAIETGLSPVPVCFTAQCHLEKYYAFCEFTSPEACTRVFILIFVFYFAFNFKILELDGRQIGSIVLRVKRPKDYAKQQEVNNIVYILLKFIRFLPNIKQNARKKNDNKKIYEPYKKMLHQFLGIQIVFII
jgi:hypothetical protein